MKFSCSTGCTRAPALVISPEKVCAFFASCYWVAMCWFMNFEYCCIIASVVDNYFIVVVISVSSVYY